METRLGKVAQATLGFWIIKIAATTLGETAGDAVTMSLNLGYLVGTAIFAAIFVLAVSAQIRASRFHPFLFWLVIVATTTVGTTLADFADRSLGIGYLGAFAWRFNRRFVLKTIHERLAIAAATTPPMPYRLLKLAEARW